MIPQTTTAVDKITAATVDAINREHQAATRAAGKAIDHAMRAGDLLNEAKRGVAHGEWQNWLAQHFHGSARTARAYMRLAEHRDLLESKTADSAVLSIDGALRLLSRPKGKRCVLCGESFTEWGNNPDPLATYDDGLCCNFCDRTKVLPARFELLERGEWNYPVNTEGAA